MDLPGRLEKRIAKVNQELTTEFAMELLTGCFFSFVIFGGMFLFVWVFATLWFPLGSWSMPIAALVTLALGVASFLTAVKNDDPFRGLRRMTELEKGLTKLSLVLSNVTYFSTEHASAGITALLTSGPSNILRSIATWKLKITPEPELIERAGEILTRCRPKLAVEELSDPMSAVLLQRLRLIKTVNEATDSPMIVLTERGKKISGADILQ